tara:strand:+ start:172 stop:423 length:252 start_codon:yes stop_codon:yes gene_type:complete
MKKGFFLIIIAMILFPASLWGLAWYFSAANTAAVFCQSNFSLFHEFGRCREPHVVLLISTVIAFTSFYILGRGAASIRKASQK